MNQVEFEATKAIITESRVIEALCHERREKDNVEITRMLKNKLLGDYVEHNIKDGANIIDLYISISQAALPLKNYNGIMQTFWNCCFDAIVEQPDHKEEETE